MLILLWLASVGHEFGRRVLRSVSSRSRCHMLCRLDSARWAMISMLLVYEGYVAVGGAGSLGGPTLLYVAPLCLTDVDSGGLNSRRPAHAVVQSFQVVRALRAIRICLAIATMCLNCCVYRALGSCP